MVGYLLLSIITSSCLFIILKKFYNWKIDTLHGLTFNYWTAALCSFIVSPDDVMNGMNSFSSIWHITAAIGLLFIIVFYITGKTTQLSGVGVASVASKMSMVIPISAGLILYNESFHLQKLAGILIALPAVILVSKPSVQGEYNKLSYYDIGLPFLLFIGAGMVDTAIKYAQHHYMNEGNRQMVIMAIFASAGTVGTLRLVYEILVLKKKLLWRSVTGGILLGITNYMSLYFLLKCLSEPKAESSTIFAFVNIGVVVTSFIAGVFLFQEKIEKNKLIGVILALIAIAILSF